MGSLRGVVTGARHRLGTAVHGAGGATHSDVRALRFELTRIDELARRADAHADHLAAASECQREITARLEGLTASFED